MTRTPQDDEALIDSLAGEPGAHERRAREWFGWRPSTGSRCPRVLAGKRCRYASDCPCQVYARLLDHPRRWITSDGRQLLTAEPYSISPSDIIGLAAECAVLALRVGIDGTSPYFPGRAILITITRAAGGTYA